MEPTPAELARGRESDLVAVKAELDRLTAENDRLRELVLRLVDGEPVTKQELEWVRREQAAHRKEDLVRLDRALRDIIATNKDGWVDMPSGRRMALSSAYERLGRVVAADASKPLEPQLGFDPDSI